MVLVQFACDEDYDDETYSLLHPLSFPISTPYNYVCNLVLGDLRKIKMVQYCHKTPWYDGIVIVTKF